MDILFSEEEERFRRRCRGWLAANVPATSRPIDAVSAEAFDRAWQRKLYEAGWAGIDWPAEYGGLGLSMIEQMIWLEEYARAHAPWIGSHFAGMNHAGPTIILHGSETQKQFYLPRTLSGDAIWCQGFSEPGAGSDFAGIATRGHIDGDALIVSGSKIWTSFAEVADYQELVVRTGHGASRHDGLSWVICDMRTPGIEVRSIRNMAGEREFAQVFYDNVRIPIANVVGGLGNGWQVAMSTLGFERGTGFIADQVKQREDVEALISQAKADGSLGDARVADQLADLRADVAALQAMTYRGISETIRTGSVGPRSSIMRLAMAELSQRIQTFAVEQIGDEVLDFRYGDTGPVYEYLKGFDATIAGGTSQIQRNIIGERILGLPRARR